jgi:hypothetical protein
MVSALLSISSFLTFGANFGIVPSSERSPHPDARKLINSSNLKIKCCYSEN